MEYDKAFFLFKEKNLGKQRKVLQKENN